LRKHCPPSDSYLLHFSSYRTNLPFYFSFNQCIQVKLQQGHTPTDQQQSPFWHDASHHPRLP
jgi:hypothetical protein